MKLSELLPELLSEVPQGLAPFAEGRDPEVSGLSHDSRRIRPGDLYVAIPGASHDGRDFAVDAAQRGAVAVLGRGEAPDDLPCPWIANQDPRALLGPLAAEIYRRPHEEIPIIGVTGTNGKTSVVRLVAEMLDVADRPCGRLGTLGYRFREHEYGAGLGRTTPEASDLFAMLRAMVDAGAKAAAMEVSSHGLELGRVDGASFDVAAFTNLTRDHLDYHGDMENYFLAKRKLFDRLKEGGCAVVPGEGEWGERLTAELPDVLTWGEGPKCAVRPQNIQLDARGIHGEITTPRGEIRIESPLLGRYNLHNLLTAVAVAEGLELPHGAVREAISRVRPLPGRLEPIEAGQPFPALIDYAHTPDALRAALEAVIDLGAPRVAAVFGCGGDRDRGKRPIMGRLAGELASLPVLTSDNPRGEDPEAILDDVEAGLVEAGCSVYRRFADRREAVRAAVEAAVDGGDGWAVLVAGKGHEEVQVIGDQTLPFSDREELLAALAAVGFTKERAPW